MSPRRASAAAILTLLMACSMARCECCGGESLSEDDRALRDAIREGDRDEAHRRLEAGASASAAGDFAMSPRELVRGEPGDWLGSYLKYHQLLWVRFFEGDPVMCPPEERGRAAAPEPGVRALAEEIGRIVGREAERVSLSFTGVTPLHAAAFFCRPGIAELLLEHGAAVDARHGAGLTPLHWAACGEVAEVLVAHGADASAASTSGLTPLHTAIGANVVRALVARRARLDARHRCGNTPLDSAPLVS